MERKSIKIQRRDSVGLMQGHAVLGHHELAEWKAILENHQEAKKVYEDLAAKEKAIQESNVADKVKGERLREVQDEVVTIRLWQIPTESLKGLKLPASAMFTLMGKALV